MNPHVILHWYWVGVFVLFGLYLMRRSRYLSVPDAIGYSSLNRARSCDPALHAAIERRAEAEGPPLPIGSWAGTICIGLGVAAVFNVSFAVLYGAMCLSLSALIAFAYLRLRNSQRLRVAVLAPRSLAAVIPPIWFAVAIIAALSMLPFVTVPGQAAVAILVCCSSLASTFIAWRLTQLPAILNGIDIAAEQRVDEKLRFLRSAVVMVFALVQPFIFVTQAAAAAHDVNALQLAAYWLNWPTWIGFGIWMRWPDPPRRAATAE